ncbi:MAG: rhomboid family intramembrane serine protease [Flavobacteriia bacterium]|jgi:membrane associated rhomboid family serine protease
MTNQLPISFLMIIIIVTVLVSLNAFNKSLVLDKMVYSPYRVKHEKEYYRLVSHMFIHADSVHLIFNMMSLYFLGSFLENELMFSFGSIGGEVHFLILYFFGGLFSTLIPFSRNQDNSNYRALGASGAVSAVIFAAIIWNPTMKLSLLFLPIPIPAYIFGPIYLAFEYWADRRGGTGIAHDAHIGGAIFGVIYVLIINIDKGKEFLSVIFG